MASFKAAAELSSTSLEDSVGIGVVDGSEMVLGVDEGFPSADLVLGCLVVDLRAFFRAAGVMITSSSDESSPNSSTDGEMADEAFGVAVLAGEGVAVADPWVHSASSLLELSESGFAQIFFVVFLLVVLLGGEVGSRRDGAPSFPR